MGFLPPKGRNSGAFTCVLLVAQRLLLAHTSPRILITKWLNWQLERKTQILLLIKQQLRLQWPV